MQNIFKGILHGYTIDGYTHRNQWKQKLYTNLRNAIHITLHKNSLGHHDPDDDCDVSEERRPVWLGLFTGEPIEIINLVSVVDFMG